jgi:hypothetical protein
MPGTPGIISGPTEICKPNTATYSVAAVVNATSYNWSLGAGATIISGSGTNVITVSFSNSAVNGNVTVNASNVCFNSSDASLAYIISGSIPTKPSIMNGSFYANCNITNVSYSCNTVSGASSYLWTVPAGVIILSGQFTNSILVKYGSGFVSTGTISVQAVNACGSSNALSRNTSSRLNQPIISGPNATCPSVISTYTAAPIVGATSYTWTPISGSSILAGQGTTSVIIKAGLFGGVLKCKANNLCGASTAGNFSVSNVCPKLINSSFEFSEITLYPNPTSTSSTLQFDAYMAGKGVLEIYDFVGRQLFNKDCEVTLGDNQLILDLNGYPKGIYTINFKYNGMVRNQKLVVQ